MKQIDLDAIERGLEEAERILAEQRTQILLDQLNRRQLEDLKNFLFVLQTQDERQIIRAVEKLSPVEAVAFTEIFGSIRINKEETSEEIARKLEADPQLMDLMSLAVDSRPEAVRMATASLNIRRATK